MREDKSLLISYLEQQKMDNSLIYDIVEFREKYDTAEKVQERVYIPDMLFYGKDILEMSAAALLQGENLLLSGAKATGKMYCARRLPGSLEDLPMIFPFMSIQTALP